MCIDHFLNQFQCIQGFLLPKRWPVTLDNFCIAVSAEHGHDIGQVSRWDESEGSWLHIRIYL